MSKIHFFFILIFFINTKKLFKINSSNFVKVYCLVNKFIYILHTYLSVRLIWLTNFLEYSYDRQTKTIVADLFFFTNFLIQPQTILIFDRLIIVSDIFIIGDDKFL